MKKIYYGKAVYDKKEINAVLNVLKNDSLTLIDGKKVKRSWVVRIPSSFVFTGAKTGGFQTIVIAETRDQAWEEASKCDEWEILDFFISHMKVFPQDPL